MIVEVYIRVFFAKSIDQFLTFITIRGEQLEKFYYKISPTKGVLKKRLSSELFNELISTCSVTKYDLTSLKGKELIKIRYNIKI